MPEATRDGRGWSSSKAKVWKTVTLWVLAFAWVSQRDDTGRIDYSACPLLGKLLALETPPACVCTRAEHPACTSAHLSPVL